jgi:hypothetical protein
MILRLARILEEIANGAEAKHVPPALPAMFLRVVQHVATLTKRSEVGGIVVARVVVQMSAGQDNIGRPHRSKSEILHRYASAIFSAPASIASIPPPSIAKVRDTLKVWPLAALAARLSAAKADCLRQLRPVDRVKPAVLGTDRHCLPLNQARA